MSCRHTGLFVAEGSSDAPLAELVQLLFGARGVELDITAPDFGLLADRVPRDVGSRVRAGLALMTARVDVLVVHRDVDKERHATRHEQVQTAVRTVGCRAELVPVLPMRMTEAWLLLDEDALRRVAGNPRGSADLGLPKASQVEQLPDPKQVLRAALLTAADVTGRRRTSMDKRFPNNRKRLLQQLDPFGPVQQLSAWQALLTDIDATAHRLTS